MCSKTCPACYCVNIIYNIHKIVSVIKTLDCCCCIGTAVTTCRRTYQDALKRDSMNRFVPWCRADGSYSPVQCFSSYCYCVNTNGQEISNTRTYVETGKPKCTHTSKSFVTFDFSDNLYIGEFWSADRFHASSSETVLFVCPFFGRVDTDNHISMRAIISINYT